MTETRERIFVFVVCGARKHIDTLHFSLGYLKLFSALKSVVVTESSRNEIPVVHENIIEVKTPAGFDHHKASIWIKTSLHRLLPAGPLYCYLDSDVIAVDENCDDIFRSFIPPVMFAADHCRLRFFSPYAVNCKCSEEFTADRLSLENAVSSVVKHQNYPPDYRNAGTREMFRKLNKITEHPFANLFAALNILIAHIIGKKRITGSLYLDVKNRQWIDDGFTYPYLYSFRKEISEKTGYRYKVSARRWIKPDGSQVAEHNCTHLADAISEDLAIGVRPCWQHWNGGVFLFGKESELFMDSWHEFTIKIFGLDNWKTRDQGSLIAAAWKYGLENHPVLGREYNFIADFYNCNIEYRELEGRIEIIDSGTVIRPCFMHVYHEFGNKEWKLWQMIEKMGVK